MSSTKMASTAAVVTTTKEATDVAIANNANNNNGNDVPPLRLDEVKSKYPRIWREYVHLSDREKSCQVSTNGEVKVNEDGVCTTIMFCDFTKPLQKLPDNVPLKTESDANKFAIFLWNLLEACESGSIGGDAYRMTGVLFAAVDDILSLRSTEDKFNHLLGFVIGVGSHGLCQFFERGDPECGKRIFKSIADEWKKVLDSGNIDSLVSPEYKTFAIKWCEELQKMLKSIKKNYGSHCVNISFLFMKKPRAPAAAKSAGAPAVSATTDDPHSPANISKTTCEESQETIRPWDIDEHWVPRSANGKQKTPNQIRNELQRYIDECKANGTCSQKKIMERMGASNTSFFKFMDPKSYRKNQWDALRNSTYLAAAKFLEIMKLEKKVAGEKRKAVEKEDGAVKKAKISSGKAEIVELLERINAVEGVPENVVYDTCPEVVAKMKKFLQRDGMTKKALSQALGNINSNSLNKFLAGKKQDQCGNVAYRNGYAFFEKLRILEGEPKTNARLKNEAENPSGFSLAKEKGRPCTYIWAVEDSRYTSFFDGSF